MTEPFPEPAPMGLDQITPATLSEYTGGKIKAADPRSELLIRGAVAAIRRYCRWHISPEREDIVILDGRGGTMQRLPSIHVVDIAEVLDGDSVLVFKQDYRWTQAGLLSRSHGRWSPHFRDVQVTMVHGFEDVPDLVALVHSVVSRAMASPLGATREQAGAMAVTWATTAPGVAGGLALLANEMSMLSSFRIQR